MKDSLGDRIKDAENAFKFTLLKRAYTIIRIDGKAFHTYCTGLNTPYDKGLVEDMQATTKFLCESIQGCKIGYVQSDEISLVLTDFDEYKTQSWFDNELQKMVSISASFQSVKN
jgi:tRNA(His) guanylyltransferase